MKRILLAMALIGSSFTAVWADGEQDGETAETVLKGTVTDLKEFRPLQNVEVTLSTLDDSYKKTTETDAEGRFIIKDIPAGTYKVCYEKSGFEYGVCQAVTVLDGQTKNIGLTMFGR